MRGLDQQPTFRSQVARVNNLEAAVAATAISSRSGTYSRTEARAPARTPLAPKPRQDESGGWKEWDAPPDGADHMTNAPLHTPVAVRAGAGWGGLGVGGNNKVSRGGYDHRPPSTPTSIPGPVRTLQVNTERAKPYDHPSHAHQATGSKLLVPQLPNFASRSSALRQRSDAAMRSADSARGMPPSSLDQGLYHTRRRQLYAGESTSGDDRSEEGGNGRNFARIADQASLPRTHTSRPIVSSSARKNGIPMHQGPESVPKRRPVSQIDRVRRDPLAKDSRGLLQSTLDFTSTATPAGRQDRPLHAETICTETTHTQRGADRNGDAKRSRVIEKEVLRSKRVTGLPPVASYREQVSVSSSTEHSALRAPKNAPRFKESPPSISRDLTAEDDLYGSDFEFDSDALTAVAKIEAAHGSLSSRDELSNASPVAPTSYDEDHRASHADGSYTWDEDGAQIVASPSWTTSTSSADLRRENKSSATRNEIDIEPIAKHRSRVGKKRTTESSLAGDDLDASPRLRDLRAGNGPSERAPKSGARPVGVLQFRASTPSPVASGDEELPETIDMSTLSDDDDILSVLQAAARKRPAGPPSSGDVVKAPSKATRFTSDTHPARNLTVAVAEVDNGQTEQAVQSVMRALDDHSTAGEVDEARQRKLKAKRKRTREADIEAARKDSAEGDPQQGKLKKKKMGPRSPRKPPQVAGEVEDAGISTSASHSNGVKRTLATSPGKTDQAASRDVLPLARRLAPAADDATAECVTSSAKAVSLDTASAATCEPAVMPRLRPTWATRPLTPEPPLDLGELVKLDQDMLPTVDVLVINSKLALRKWLEPLLQALDGRRSVHGLEGVDTLDTVTSIDLGCFPDMRTCNMLAKLAAAIRTTGEPIFRRVKRITIRAGARNGLARHTYKLKAPKRQTHAKGFACLAHPSAVCLDIGIDSVGARRFFNIVNAACDSITDVYVHAGTGGPDILVGGVRHHVVLPRSLPIFKPQYDVAEVVGFDFLEGLGDELIDDDEGLGGTMKQIVNAKLLRMTTRTPHAEMWLERLMAFRSDRSCVASFKRAELEVIFPLLEPRSAVSDSHKDTARIKRGLADLVLAIEAAGWEHDVARKGVTFRRGPVQRKERDGCGIRVDENV